MPRSALAAVALLIALAACSGSSPSPSTSEPESSSSASEAGASVPASEAPSEGAAASNPAAGHGGVVRLAIDTGDYAGNYLSEFESGSCDVDGTALTIDLSGRRDSYDNETTLLDAVSARVDNLMEAMANDFEGDVTAVFHLTREGQPDAEVTIGPEIEGWRNVSAESDALTTGTIQIEGEPANGEFTATITCYGVPLS
jgi:hypothetical protein